MVFDDYEMPEKEMEYIVESMIDKARSGDAAAAQWLEDHGFMPKLRGKYKHPKPRRISAALPGETAPDDMLGSDDPLHGGDERGFERGDD